MEWKNSSVFWTIQEIGILVLVIPLYKEFRIETENLGIFAMTDGRSENWSRREREGDRERERERIATSWY